MNEEALLELYRKFEHLRNCNKKADKIECLKEYQSDALFTFVLEFLLNTDKKTGISDAKLNKDLTDKPYEPFICLKALINYVIGNPTGKDNVVHSVQQYIESLPNFTLQRFITEIITKKYKCGVTAKFVGEVLPNLIKVEHQVMLANRFTGELKEEAFVTLKLDGIRCSILIEDKDNIKFLTRQGKEIEGLKQIRNSLFENMDLTGYLLDGELLRINNDNLPSEENFKLTTSIVNSKSENKEGLEFVIFDMVSLEDYKSRNSNMIYRDRYHLIGSKVNQNDHIKIVPLYGVTEDPEEVYSLLSDVTSQGYEGLMLNLANGLYKFGKRSNDLLKVKAMHTCDLKCIDVQEGEGKYANTLGRILCLYKGHILKVGSGFTDEERDYYWKHKDKIKMQIVEIQYFEESNNEQGGLSLRFPVFKRVRDDKDEESYE